MSDENNPRRPTGRALEARGVRKTYRVGDVTVRALDGVSLAVAPGELVFITGRNGAGKSTLLHCLAVLDEPDEGTIVVEGADVMTLTPGQRADLRVHRLGYVFQERALVAELTALENVMLPAMVLSSTDEARRRATALLAQVGLTRHAGHLPGQLSGGQQQRVAIARALVNDPSILFVDEPTTSLDSTAARDVLATLARLNREDGRTIVMVSHEESDAGCATRFIRMSDGAIAEDRAPA